MYHLISSIYDILFTIYNYYFQLIFTYYFYLRLLFIFSTYCFYLLFLPLFIVKYLSFAIDYLLF